MPKTNAARIWALNHQVLARVMRDCAPDFEVLGLEAKEFFVLAEVDRYLYPAELAARLVLPKPTVTVYLKSLESKGFIRRAIDPDDLRRHRLVVTTTGNNTLGQALVVLSEKFDQWLDGLEEQERSDLQRLLEKLLSQNGSPSSAPAPRLKAR